MILLQNEVCNHCYYVNKSCLRLFTINKDGAAGMSYFAFEGASGAALPGLFEQEPAFEFGQTVKKSAMVSIWEIAFSFGGYCSSICFYLKTNFRSYLCIDRKKNLWLTKFRGFEKSKMGIES